MQQNVVTLNVTDHLDMANSLMRIDRIRHLPVVDQADAVVGIVSQRDLFRAGVSSLLEFSEPAQNRWLAQIRVRDVMTKEVFIVHPDAAVRTAVQLMLDRRVGCLPVVENENLVGMLSERDCMHYLARLLELSEMRELLPDDPLE
jgi:CBS domain-containing protein